MSQVARPPRDLFLEMLDSHERRLRALEAGQRLASGEPGLLREETETAFEEVEASSLPAPAPRPSEAPQA